MPLYKSSRGGSLASAVLPEAMLSEVELVVVVGIVGSSLHLHAHSL